MDKIESALFLMQIVIIILIVPSFLSFVSAPPGENPPEVLNVSLENFLQNTTLIAASTKTISCVARINDTDGQDAIGNVTAVFYDTTAASQDSQDDNNNHYTNSSCDINKDFGSWQGHADDEYQILSNCTFEVQYYANPGDWKCIINATDNTSRSNTNEDTIEIFELLAISLPDSIDYGTVSPMKVSGEQQVVVENMGNVPINITISAYGAIPGDNLSMNCTEGETPTIGTEYERYNLTDTTPGSIDLSELQQSYKAVSNETITEIINLNYRQVDVSSEAATSTYWRIYTPLGAAGTCNGNINFGAVIS